MSTENHATTNRGGAASNSGHQPIEELWITNHTHHDIGFNDYQDVCFRQHGEFIEQALDLIEQTADDPEPYRWTCKATGPLLRWLRGAGRGQAERLRHWAEQGAIEVTAMQYNTTPLLSPEQMRRSLYPVRTLREDYGLTIQTAMQDDVNGIAWLFADLLPAIGVDFLTLAINQSRGGAPRPFPGGFIWEGPAGGRLPVWNGFHYLFGRSQVRLGDWQLVEQKLPAYLELLEGAEWFDSRVLYLEAIHPMRVDNGPPDARMAEFVHRWNQEGRTPRMRFVTPVMWRDEVLADQAQHWPTRRGDWTDWWADGAASSAFETGTNRATHEVVRAAETLGAWLRAAGLPEESEAVMERVWESMNLYDEHTWGGFSSIDAPQSLFTRAQWNRKAGFAYEAAMNGHDALTRQARTLVESLAERASTTSPDAPSSLAAGEQSQDSARTQHGRVEGRFNLGDLDDQVAFPPTEGRLTVLNTLPRERTVLVEVPEYRAGGAPAGMLESAFPRGVPWGGQPETPRQCVRVDLPALGVATATAADGADTSDLVADGLRLENQFYRVEVDAETGTIASWVDKSTGAELAAPLPVSGAASGPMQEGFGALVREIVRSDLGRDALYLQDFASWDFGYWRERDEVPFALSVARPTTIEPATIDNGVAQVIVRAEHEGLRSATLRIGLVSGRPELQVDWLIDKEPYLDPESWYVAFGSPQVPHYRCDLNGVPSTPWSASHGGDQLDGSVEYFTPIGRWASVGESSRMVLCPLDAPLVQFGGITTNQFTPNPSTTNPPTGGTLDEVLAGIASRALNNHWMVNFRVEQSGEIPLRHRLTSTDSEAEAMRFAEDVFVPPIVLRDY